MKPHNRFLCRLALVAIWHNVTLLKAEEFREWNDASGRKVEAAFAGVEGDNVKLRLRNGTLLPYPLEKLSKADQDWAKQQTTAKPAAAPAFGAKPESGSAWPRSVGLDEAPNATVVKEDTATSEYVYRTNNFEFRCDSRLGKDVVREFGRIFEGTLRANKELPLGIDPKPEPGQEYFVATLCTKESDYFANGGIKGSAGVYSRGAKSIKVPLKSLGVRLAGKHFVVEPQAENDTLIHEITHQMMNHWLNKLPEWYVEGSAMYVASSKYNMGRFTMPKLGQTVKNLEHLRQGKHTIWHLDYLMQITPAQWHAAFGENPDGTVNRNYTSAIALTYWLCHGDDKGDGTHMIAFMKDIAAGKKWKDAQNEHLIRGRDYAQMEKEMVNTLRKGGITVDFADGPVKTSVSQ
jgi:SLA1 homology domain 1, SHD1